jgi:hypothetical protein
MKDIAVTTEKEIRTMKILLRLHIITLIFAFALAGLYLTNAAGAAKDTTPPALQEAEASLIKDGPQLINEGRYLQVLESIRKLPPQQQGGLQIRVLEYFANLKGWVGAKDRTFRTRWWALREQLINAGDTSATPLIAAFLKDTDDWVRLYAAELLGYIGDRQALEELNSVAKTDPNAKVKKYAAWAYKELTAEAPSTTTSTSATPPTRSSRKTKPNTFTIENPYTKDPTALVAITTIAAAKRGTLESYRFAHTAPDAAIEIDTQSDLATFFLTAAVVTDYFKNEDGSILMGGGNRVYRSFGEAGLVGKSDRLYATQTPFEG